jgi:hypothetical protein
MHRNPVASLLLDSIPEATHVAVHNTLCGATYEGFRCAISARPLAVFWHFEGNSKLSLHQREERRLTVGQRLPLAPRGCEN